MELNGMEWMKVVGGESERVEPSIEKAQFILYE